MLSFCTIHTKSRATFAIPLDDWITLYITFCDTYVFPIVTVRMGFRIVTAIKIIKNICGIEWYIFCYLIIYRIFRMSLYWWRRWYIPENLSDFVLILKLKSTVMLYNYYGIVLSRVFNESYVFFNILRSIMIFFSEYFYWISWTQKLSFTRYFSL